jgi:signal transduction histidine kinase
MVTLQTFAQLPHKFLEDINEGHEDALRYPKLDDFSIRLLWWHYIVFGIFVFLNSYVQIADYVPSPFSWRVISSGEAFASLSIGFIALALPIFLRNTFKRHFYYRILLTACLITYSYLFVFITGGAIEAHFHFFIVIAYIAAYADWRLGWFALVLTVAHHVVLDFVAPQWVFFYGENWLSPFAHGIPVLVAVILTSFLSRTQREALLAQKELEKRREEFISMASHELRTPVTSITLLTETFEHMLKAKNLHDFDAPIQNLKEQSRLITKLISDLLDASRAGLFGLSYSFVTFDLNELVLEVVTTLRDFDTTRNIQISGRVTGLIYGDRDRIGQVLVNLLTNALKYSPASSSVEVTLTQKGSAAIVCVRDHGIGIDKVHHKKIFERFYRVLERDEKTYPGMGIGLNISYEIIKRHKGSLWVESEKGSGSNFFISLPISHS